MATVSVGLLRIAMIGVCATLAVAPGLTTTGKAADTIRVWKVGSPQRGDTPTPRVLSGLQQASTTRGFRIAVEALPATEFAYQDDARLFVRRPARPGSEPQISAGQLWTTGGEWNWRVWSVTRAGDVVFSDARTFLH
jgi:hypothetical protein